ncbi:phosphoenolpyruvate carboxykinase (ATP) [Paenibacillus alkalitolerans]|uniref:aldolase n=1 Tax=Paenibacillus alkalitolerans TaxID=2799335 RepID=UPI0018F2A98B|nr:aldolase [Paenibacillus alkalitolerans]
MIQTGKPAVYTAFGLGIASELSLPELPQAAGQAFEADLEIIAGELSGVWEEYGSPDDYYAFTDNQILFHAPGIAIYSIRDGKQIIVSPVAGAEQKLIRLYLLGTCMGAILIQRKTLPLHGSAVVINGKAYAFVGDSGAGKSTLAAAFLHSGFPLLSDDVIAVSFGRDGKIPLIVPSYPQQKLWEESIVRLGMATDHYDPFYASKYAVPVSSKFCRETVPLAGIFELAKADRDQPEIECCQGLERLPILRMHTYRNFMIPHTAGERWHFSTVTKIVSHASIYKLRRPSAGFSVHELVTLVLHTVQEAESVIRG